MKVVSLNLSKVKSVEYKGKTVTTGIFKKPVQQPVYIDNNSLRGDEQADLTYHGGEFKAVYGFCADHYNYWQEALGQPDLPYGIFGENLTVTDLDEAKLCIGDHLSIGECILEVSEPRVPCFKLGIALQNDKAPNLFTKSWCTGVYFRVEKPGFITANDEVKIIKKATDSVTVQALFRAYYDRDFVDAQKVLEKALTVAALAPDWREKALKRINRDQL
jgi:MOSC domain-containing protein YiiM